MPRGDLALERLHALGRDPFASFILIRSCLGLSLPSSYTSQGDLFPQAQVLSVGSLFMFAF